MISLEDIEKLAALSRVLLREDEKKRLVSEIESILGYVSEIQHVVADVQIAHEKPTLRNVMREDGDVHERGVYSEALLHEAPEKEGSLVRVKKIL